MYKEDICKQIEKVRIKIASKHDKKKKKKELCPFPREEIFLLLAGTLFNGPCPQQ